MINKSSQTYYFLWPHLCLTRLNEFRFFLTYFLCTSFKFSSMQSVECALKVARLDFFGGIPPKFEH